MKEDPSAGSLASVRLDVWLDVACVYPTRSQAKAACEGGKVDVNGARAKPHREIRAGDTVWIPPGEKHWHGAAPNIGMVHIAMQEALDGKHVDWMELVTDEEYSQPVES